jgi:hypothetical protein
MMRCPWSSDKTLYVYAESVKDNWGGGPPIWTRGEFSTLSHAVFVMNAFAQHTQT